MFACNFISKKGLEKNMTFKISLKRIFTSSSVIEISVFLWIFTGF